MNDRRKGKIARLPLKIRQVVNEMLEDGTTYPRIVEHLTGLGYPDICERNVSRWYLGGFQDWKREQERLVALQVDVEFAQSVMAQNPECPVQEAGIKILG